MATSAKQIAANRRNAKKSTGPTSPEGRAVARGDMEREDWMLDHVQQDRTCDSAQGEVDKARCARSHSWPRSARK